MIPPHWPYKATVPEGLPVTVGAAVDNETLKDTDAEGVAGTVKLAVALCDAVTVTKVVGPTRVGVVGLVELDEDDAMAGITAELDTDATGTLLETTGREPEPSHEATGPPGAV